jgi:AAA ATPase domain
MDRVDNPFAPGAGTRPPALVGRDKVLENARIALERVKGRRHSKSFLLVGLRGVGKTVLLNEIQKSADQLGYKSVLIEAPENKRLPALLLPYLRQILLALDRFENISEKVRRGMRVLTAFAKSVHLKYGDAEISFGIPAENGTADTGDLEQDLPELLVAVAEAGESRGVPIAIFIDEMQYLNEAELSALIMAVHKISQHNLPMLLIGAGLPQLVGLTGKSKSYAERLFDFPIVGPLTGEDARNALQVPVKKYGISFDEDALNEIVDLTKGYPYFIQVWGYYSWDIAEFSPIGIDVIKGIRSTVIQYLDDNFFRVRFDRLTPRERDYMRAMAELGSDAHRSGDIADVLGIHVQSAAPLRSGLIKKGMIYSPSHGDTAFTVPLFDSYMKRIMPNLPKKHNFVKK